MIEHRVRAIRDKFQFLSMKTIRPQRELKTSPDMREELHSVNSQLDHLESLTQSLEPIDETETDVNVHRTKFHRFIRIHDDLDILNERLININDHLSSLHSNEQMRMTNDLKFLFDRLNSIKRIVRIHLDQLEKLLARTQLNSSLSLSRNSSLRASNSNLQVRFEIDFIGLYVIVFLFSVFFSEDWTIIIIIIPLLFFFFFCMRMLSFLWCQ